MDITDIRCIIEGVILPLLAWLAKLFGSKKNVPAEATQKAADIPVVPARLTPPRQYDMAPQILQLQRNGDLYGLLSVLHADPDPVLRLDAADALAQLGHEEGVDYLIERLAAPDILEQAAAREILTELNDSRGNAALQRPPVAVAEAAAAPAGPSVMADSVGSSAQQERSAGTGIANDAWATYLEKQASLEAGRTAAPQAATTSIDPLAATGAPSTAQAKQPRWVRDFLPGALGALLITLASAAFLYFATPANASEQEQGLIISQLICLPVPLGMGALFGSVAALFTKRILLALHASEGVQATTATIGSFISGAISGFLCDFFFMMAAAL